MTYVAILAGAGWLLAVGALAWLAAESRAHRTQISLITEAKRYNEQNLIMQLNGMSATITKMGARESKPEAVAKALGEQVAKIADSFNESLTRIMVGYQHTTPGGVVSTPDELNFDKLDNSFPIDQARQWLPAHEFADSNMWPDGVPELKPTPQDGNGGWVE